MRAEYEHLLTERWPEIFRGRDRPESRISEGCVHGDGWLGIVDAVCEVLSQHATAVGRKVPKATQVKEKLGGLRYYTANNDAYGWGAISLAEEYAYRVCELSGAPGRLAIRDGWLKTLSPAMAERHGFTDYHRSGATLQPIDLTQIAATLALRRPVTLVGPVDIPVGWADLADILVKYIALGDRSGELSNVRVRLAADDNRLQTTLEGRVRPIDEGAAAFATAMSERLDQTTGAFRFPEPGPQKITDDL